MKTTTASQHTPTPWKVIGREEIWGATEKLIADMSHSAYGDGQAIEANATFIVRAVNSHQELLELAHIILRLSFQRGNTELMRRCKEAIAKAEGRE